MHNPEGQSVARRFRSGLKEIDAKGEKLLPRERIFLRSLQKFSAIKVDKVCWFIRRLAALRNVVDAYPKKSPERLHRFNERSESSSIGSEESKPRHLTQNATRHIDDLEALMNRFHQSDCLLVVESKSFTAENRPHCVDNGDVKDIAVIALNVNDFSTALAQMFNELFSFAFNVIHHAQFSQTKALHCFHREKSLFFPELTVSEDESQTLVEGSDTEEKSVRATVQLLSLVQLSDLIFARHHNDVISDESQANERSVSF